MGLLGDIYSASDSLKRKVKGLLSDPAGYLEQVGGILSDDRKTTAERQARVIHNPESITQEDVATAMNTATGFAPLGMTAWHGSPHKFDKFSLDKIGTGEGAQAYGHGLYLAESLEVAKEYQQALTRTSQTGQSKADYFVDGAKVDLPEYTNAKAAHYAASRGELDKFVDTWKRMPDSDIKKKYLAQAEALMGKNVTEKIDAGSLYKTDIPDEAVARFLDWDKPLSQQAPEVQPVLRDMLTKARKSFSGIDPAGDPIAGQVHHLYAQHRGGNANAVAEELAQQGIPGIRYLDGGSRGAGQGSSNFVAFDPEMIRILERNGQDTGLQPWQPGEWGGLLK